MKPTLQEPPPELFGSLKRLKDDYPYPTRIAFVMMKFGRTTAHDGIFKVLEAALASLSIVALRADGKDYHDDLYPNILTYIYGCDFGIAVFDRVESDEFNPNVSLEVGYMMALGKPICLLKDQTLRTLQTDLAGKLYRTFDPLHPETSIPIELTKWIKGKGLL